MKTKERYIRHTVCLVGIFTLGEAVISAPFAGADSLNILALLCATVIAAVAAALITPLFDFGFSEEFFRDTPLRRVFGTLISSIAIIFSVFLAAKSFVSYTDFVSGAMLTKAPFSLIALVFAAVTVLFALSSQNSIFKFALIASVLAAVIILLFFVLSLPHFEVRNIVPYKFTLSSDLFSQIGTYLVRVFLPVAVVIIYVCLTRGNPRGNILSDGVLFGAIMLILCVANSIMVFGAEVAAQLQHPYADAISTVSLGDLFTRMDGFSYFLFFAVSVTKVTVCLKTALILITRLGFKYKKTFVAVCGALMFVLSVI